MVYLLKKRKGVFARRQRSVRSPTCILLQFNVRLEREGVGRGTQKYFHSD